MHILLKHSVDFLERTQGFGDLGEDAGERAHQTESKTESRVVAIKNLVKKENIKAQYEYMANNPSVMEVTHQMINATKQKKQNRQQNGAYDNLDVIFTSLADLLEQTDGNSVLLSELKKERIILTHNAPIKLLPI